MSAYARQRASERIDRLAAAGLDVATFLDETARVLDRAVPNGTDHLDGPYWYTLDPDSLLITSDYGGEGCGLDTSAVMRWEYLEQDVNKYDEVLRHPRGVQTLHEVTDRRPESSRIYCEYMRPHGIEQEMLVALRARSGECWGTVRMNRGPGEPDFDSGEVEFMATVAPRLADGVRRGLLVAEASEPDRPESPGLVVLDDAGGIDSIGPGADRWIELLPGASAAGPLPAAVASVAAAALDGAGPGESAGEPYVRVRGQDGRWLSVHGASIRVGGSVKAAIIIEAAHHDRIAPLLLAIYGLTAREEQVTRLVLHGEPTSRIASELQITPHTVQQHLKAIFEKTGVHSRRELVGKLFVENFDARVSDNGRRVREDRPIRGGPLRTDR